MRHLWRLTGASALALLVFAMPAAAVPDQGKAQDKSMKHDFRSPMAKKQDALREVALQARMEGKGTGRVQRVAKGQYVELERTGEDQIWTVLGEFGDQTATDHPASHGSHAGGTDGPLHNEIVEPDRSNDNITIWTDDFSREYFEDLLFSEEPGANSMRNFYIEQSNNRYAVDGDVTDWMQVPYNARSYGSDYCGSIVCQDTWRFVEDSLTAWYDSQIAAGKTPAEIDQYLSKFDVWDRYDHDGDGNFDESDGYIDHFQSVHAGEGQETGGGAQGSDAIWSHRWYIQTTRIGSGGPTLDDGSTVPFGGTRVGQSKYWVGDYTIEPENGGVGVFAHEYAHDLGLPDLYDTSGNTGGAENSTGFWTIMSSGSYGNDGTEDIGSKPIGFGVWEKFQLGWLKYDVARAGRTSVHKLAPSIGNTKQAQGAFVILPPKSVELELGAPYAGSKFYYSGAGDNLDNFMTKSVTLPAGSSITAQVRYAIEVDWDYAYVVVSTDGGNTWTGVPTNLSTSTDPNGQNFGNGITGSTGGAWVPLTADLSGYSGSVLIGFRYWTDGAVVESGFQIDDISIAGGAADGAETDAGWTFKGFRTTTGTESRLYNNYYVLENRQYVGYDAGLETGPYNFGFLNTRPDWVERFPYQDGLLVSYWDTSQSDNNVGDHPGEGLVLPVDARPTLEHWTDGTLMRPRIQAFDSTFGLQATDEITLNKDGVPVTIPSRAAEPVFNDLESYWTANDGHPTHPDRYQPGWNGVDVPKTGTSVIVTKEETGALGMYMQIEVRPSE